MSDMQFFVVRVIEIVAANSRPSYKLDCPLADLGERLQSLLCSHSVYLPKDSHLPHPMTSHTQLVPIRIAEVRAVVMRVVFGPQAGWAFAGAAVGQRQGVHVLHLLA